MGFALCGTMPLSGTRCSSTCLGIQHSSVTFYFCFSFESKLADGLFSDIFPRCALRKVKPVEPVCARAECKVSEFIPPDYRHKRKTSFHVIFHTLNRNRFFPTFPAFGSVFFFSSFFLPVNKPKKRLQRKLSLTRRV